ncbi:MAG: LysM peptidoglycan-binding domain-containing protein [Candidatus Aminicenantales bacterium]
MVGVKLLMLYFGILAGLALNAAVGVSSPPLPVLLPDDAPAAYVSSHDSASFLGMNDDELMKLVENDPSALGSLSIGTPASAILINPVMLPADPLWEAASLSQNWATTETVEAIRKVVAKVHEVFPDAPPIMIGDISDFDGGRLKRHVSHQAGRDVDFGFYYKGGKLPYFANGTTATLDLPKNWALLRAIITCTDVETVFLDTSIQKLLYGYARGIGEDKAWLDGVFQFIKGSSSAIVCYCRGHRNHYHVRFYNPVAQELGRRVYPMLVELHKIKPPVFTIPHVAREGETLGHIAARYGSSVRAIQQYNGLATTQIRTGHTYRVPMRGVAAPKAAPLVVPARQLPPLTPEAMSSAEWPLAESAYREKLLKMAELSILGSTAFRRI